MKQSPHRSGFTLIELVVVIMIMSVLAGALVPRVTDRMTSARDNRRLQDIRTIRDAIEQYYLDKGVYPPADKNAGAGGWDVSHDGDFISSLTESGYLGHVPSDPMNDGTYHYRYYVYDHGSYGCKGDGPYYVLGVRKFESPSTTANSAGYFRCSGRDWSKEFDYVTGGGASLSE